MCCKHLVGFSTIQFKIHSLSPKWPASNLLNCDKVGASTTSEGKKIQWLITLTEKNLLRKSMFWLNPERALSFWVHTVWMERLLNPSSTDSNLKPMVLVASKAITASFSCEVGCPDLIMQLCLTLHNLILMILISIMAQVIYITSGLCYGRFCEEKWTEK